MGHGAWASSGKTRARQGISGKKFCHFDVQAISVEAGLGPMWPSWDLPCSSGTAKDGPVGPSAGKDEADHD